MLDSKLAASPRAQRALADLADRPLNFDPAELDGAGEETGWHVDDYRRVLAPEPPGDPLPEGSFAIACRLLREYAFADPSLVRAVYDPDTQLAERNMLLQARLGPLRAYVGCRVRTVTDETRLMDGRAVRVWGWGYGTLAGHVERGQMDYAVCKWLDDGTVEFRIHVVSQRARDGNPIVRLGFRLVGRRLQVRFARRSLERMAALVRRDLRTPRSALGQEPGAPQQAP